MSAEPQVWSPRTLQDALAILADNPRATVLAGGTDLMVQVHGGAVALDWVLNIWGLPLCGIALDGDELVFGALDTYAQLIASPLCQQYAPGLVAAAKTVGAVQIQNRGTVAGNLVNASPAADSAPILLACDATVVLESRDRGARRVPLTEFFKSYKVTARQPDELLTQLRVPKKRPEHRDFFVKVGTRRAQAISKVALAGRARLGPQGRLLEVALAAGSVGPTPLRLPQTEAALVGALAGPALEATARQSAAAEVHPIDDIRSTAAYRATVTGNLAARFVRAMGAST